MTCHSCQYWTGANNSSMAICKLPRPGNGFTVTGSLVTCPAYQQSTPPAHLAIEPANYQTITETFETTSGGAIVTGETTKG